MNSISKYSKDEINKDYDSKGYCGDCQHPVPGKALLKCNNGVFQLTNITFPAANSSVVLNTPIASVNVDTTCLCNPNRLISFEGILTVRPITVVALSTLNFTLFKICKGNRTPVPLTNFSFSYVNFFAAVDSRSLNFEYSSCDDECEECCTYILQLTNITNLIAGTIRFEINGKLCVLAVESPKK